MEVGKVIKRGEDLFFFFFFLLFTFENNRNLFLGLPKWEFSTGKKHFMPGKKSGKMTLPPQKNMPVTPLSAAGCRFIQKTSSLWKHGLTSKNTTHSQLTYFCKSNINLTFINGSGMIWGVRIAIFTEIRHLVEELITFLSFFGPQKLGILTAKLNKSLSISTSTCINERGLVCWSMLKTFTAIVRTTAFEKLCDRPCMPSKVSWIGIIVCG